MYKQPTFKIFLSSYSSKICNNISLLILGNALSTQMCYFTVGSWKLSYENNRTTLMDLTQQIESTNKVDQVAKLG